MRNEEWGMREFDCCRLTIGVRRLFFLLILLTCSVGVWAWRAWPLPMDSVDNCRDTLCYFGEFAGVASSGKFAPFWFSANTDGVVSTSPFSVYLRAGIEKSAVRQARWWDYSYGADVRVQVTVNRQVDNSLQRVGDKVRSVGYGLQFVKLYAHARLWCFDVMVGIKPYDMGNHDYELSAGGFLFSRNALSLPRVSIGIDKYTAFPFTYGYMEIKGGITHGWFVDNVGTKRALLHHKYLGVRLGGRLPVNVNYEFHHAAQWGGVSEVYGELGSSLRDWWTVFKASSGGVMGNDQINAMGNHLGSQMLGVEVKHSGWYVNAYWQMVFEDGPIKYMWKSMNVCDGLWGVVIKQKHWKFIHSLSYEFFATTDQSGPCHDFDGIVFGGADNYFNNSIYTQGWSHFGMVMGNPFITSPIYTSSLSTLNNRTFTHHIAMKGDIYGFQYLLRYSHSDNYGTYKRPFESSNNSIFLSVNKLVPQAWNLNFGIAIGGDIGTQFGNSFGAMVMVSRRGIIWKSKK